jgi:predicted ATPase
MSQKFLMQSIDIKGFKSFNAEGQKLELGDLTVLIGANGAGKSNLISFFRMITNMMNDSLHKYIGINGGADSLLYLGQKRLLKLKVSLNLVLITPCRITDLFCHTPLGILCSFLRKDRIGNLKQGSA